MAIFSICKMAVVAVVHSCNSVYSYTNARFIDTVLSRCRSDFVVSCVSYILMRAMPTVETAPRFKEPAVTGEQETAPATDGMATQATLCQD
jgi:hypothetical protein